MGHNAAPRLVGAGELIGGALGTYMTGGAAAPITVPLMMGGATGAITGKYTPSIMGGAGGALGGAGAGAMNGFGSLTGAGAAPTGAIGMPPSQNYGVPPISTGQAPGSGVMLPSAAMPAPTGPPDAGWSDRIFGSQGKPGYLGQASQVAGLAGQLQQMQPPPQQAPPPAPLAPQAPPIPITVPSSGGDGLDPRIMQMVKALFGQQGGMNG